MDVDERRTPDDEVGRQIAAGRDATIHAIGTDRVLRRIPGPQRDLLPEATAMEAIRATGYPVPEVFRVGPGEMVLARIDGPTMLDDLEAHPWRIDRHARTLADLHTRLHRITPPPGLVAYHVPGDAVLHRDLHPGNVILSPDGPVVIDWTNVQRGDPAADVALSWILMAAFELDDEPITGSLPHRAFVRAERAITPWIRKRLVATFLRASGVVEEARAVLAAAAEDRLLDRNVRPGEALAIKALVAREARPHPG
ncbi:phosphotransferase family protein [Aquihabitans sp. McL0605]|uniref:phosphotransferase family protein n=1 Tax=Aquihabitans sp. McL0605 TaxID=3415671 RepID=UPI003CEAF889